MRIRGLIVLATIAALLGAPSIASGAGNSLASPSATTSPAAPEGADDEHDAPAAPAGPTADRADQGEETHAGSREGMLGLVLMVGLSGVAAVAIIGTARVVIGRRRSDDPEAASALDGTAEAADTETLLQRRIVRRAKIRLADDPIVVAMGVDDQVDARRRRDATRRGRDAGRPAAGEPRDRAPRGRP
jgi:hypothetical protein